LSAAPDARGVALARYASQDLGFRRVVALTDSRNAVNAALAAAFAGELRKAHSGDKQTVLAEWPLSKESEWAEVSSRLVIENPDAVLFGTDPREFLGRRALLAGAGVKAALLYAGEDQGIRAFVEDPGTGPDVFLVTGFAAEADLSAEGKAFVRAYEEKFHERPDLASALAYDGVRILAAARERANSTGTEPLCKALAELSGFPSVTGPLSLADRRAKRTLFVASVRGRNAKVVRTFGPDLE
jgi:branched-chain amino acid transport system substrate-binding protein